MFINNYFSNLYPFLQQASDKIPGIFFIIVSFQYVESFVCKVITLSKEFFVLRNFPTKPQKALKI